LQAIYTQSHSIQWLVDLMANTSGGLTNDG